MLSIQFTYTDPVSVFWDSVYKNSQLAHKSIRVAKLIGIFCIKAIFARDFWR